MNDLVPTYFLNILCDHCLHDLQLYVLKILTDREMGNFPKWDFFRFFFCTFTIDCVTTGARKMHIEYIFCFICSEQCIKIISSRKKCGLFVSVFKKSPQITLLLLFKKWVDLLNPSHYVYGIRTSHGIALTITKLVDFYSQGIFYFFVCHRFQLK